MDRDPISNFVDSLSCTDEVKKKNKELLMKLLVTKHITVRYDDNTMKIFGVKLDDDGKVRYENTKKKKTNVVT
jgi:hypothetical protein